MQRVFFLIFHLFTNKTKKNTNIILNNYTNYVYINNI